MSGDVQIRMGHTPVAVDALSTDFDANAPGGLATVFDDSTFSQPVMGGSESFTLRFTLAPPFDYDPAAGNLLGGPFVDSAASRIELVLPEPGAAAAGAAAALALALVAARARHGWPASRFGAVSR